MIHNGIEYGIMAAYAEGIGILKAADAGKSQSEVDAETTPLRDPEHYQYELNLADIAEVWRRGSVVTSWLLDLTAGRPPHDPQAEPLSRPAPRPRGRPRTLPPPLRQGGAAPPPPPAPRRRVH